ncbi:MAG: hypothetical protein RBU30_19245, partial [Polyangia bacterium]|nr:hypothetical protein [Polyangia bacterium]
RVVIDSVKAQSKEKSKTVSLHVLIDPSTSDLFEVRGEIPEEVTAPTSGFTFKPSQGTTARGKFTCQACGRTQAVVDSADAYGEPLPFRFYGYYAHTPYGRRGKSATKEAQRLGLDTNSFKWFGEATEEDQRRIRDAEAELSATRNQLPIPDQEIPPGRNFRDLLRQGYRRWSDLYNPRHLLALGLLLRAIAEEPNPTLRDAVLAGFKVSLGCMSNLALWSVSTTKVERVNSAHDYRNPTSTAENNVWGLEDHGRGSFVSSFMQSKGGLDLASSNYEWMRLDNGDVVKHQLTGSGGYSGKLVDLIRSSSTAIPVGSCNVDLVVTDPPYAGSVQYAEMSDWYYVWLHKVLADHYPEFESEITLKAQEIIEDTNDKGAVWFFEQMTLAWKECHRVLKEDGLLVFTFHHREGDRWSGLLRSLFDAGFYLVAAYPTHSEALNSIVIQATKGITYDIIHVCRKRLAEPEEIPWSLLRKQVRREAQEQLQELEAGGDVLPGPDVWMILLGKALKLFSQHYGKVIDADGEPISLEDGFERLSTLLREVRGEAAPLPADLQGIDGLSQVYFIHVLGKAGWTRDGLHIELRGYIHSTDDLLEMDLVTLDPNDKARLIPVRAKERYARRHGRFTDGLKAPLVDKLHLLVGAEEAGEDVSPWLRRWEPQWDALVEGLKLLGKHEPAVRDGTGRLVRLIGTLVPGQDDKARQTRLF